MCYSYHCLGVYTGISGLGTRVYQGALDPGLFFGKGPWYKKVSCFQHLALNLSHRRSTVSTCIASLGLGICTWWQPPWWHFRRLFGFCKLSLEKAYYEALWVFFGFFRILYCLLTTKVPPVGFSKFLKRHLNPRTVSRSG